MQQAFFDTYAQTYDDHFTNSLIGKAQRELVHQYLLKIKDSNAGVLEINGGTGEDALFLSQHFKCVTCTDVSEAMLSIAKHKNKENSNAFFERSSIQELTNNVKGEFDLVFSNFGGLNCLSPAELQQLEKDLNVIAKKDLVFVIMGRKCLWECFIFWWRNDKQRRGRRVDINGTLAELNGKKFRIHYYSAKEIRDLFEVNYNQVKCMPIGFFIPPSYLEASMKKRRFYFTILNTLDSFVKSMSFLSNYADHYLIHLKRT